MSGDVQPRKRKDKRKKKDEDEMVHHSSGSSDEVIHVYKESKLGGNIFAKIVFFGLLGALGLMVGLIIFEYHGTSEVDSASAADSPWSLTLEGWVDNSPDDHGDEHGGEHDEHDEHGDEHDHDEEHDDHDNEFSEGEGEVEHDHEEETEEETEDESYVKQTYEELRAAYTQAPADEGESDVDITEDSLAKSTEEYGATESEPEASEPEEEEEDSLMEDEPVPQWKSESGPELLREEVEEVQTEEETEEESEEEALASGGPKSAEAQEEQAFKDFVDSISEPVIITEPVKQESPQQQQDQSADYEKADITNEADWEIKEQLDKADQDLEEGDFL